MHDVQYIVYSSHAGTVRRRLPVHAGGYASVALAWVVTNRGIDTESDYPYTWRRRRGDRRKKCNAMKQEFKEVTIDGVQAGVLPPTRDGTSARLDDIPVNGT